MRTHRSHMLSKLTTLVLVAIVATGCSSTASADASVFDQVRDLGQDLNRAVSATQDAVTGYAQPQFAARAIDRASSTSRQLGETVTKVQSPDLRTPASELVSVANRIVTLLTQGDVEDAEALRANDFVPLASEIAQLKGSLPATTRAPESSGVSAMTVAYVIVVLTVGGVAAFLMRGRDRTADTTSATTQNRPAASTPERRGDRAWDEPHALYSDAQPAEPTLSENPDVARSTRMRQVDIELHALLEATIDQVKERAWAVSLLCPEVHIAGDPVRVQRAILATLGNAFLEGAELVGIVVDVVDGQVLVSIGHDAPIDDAKAKTIAVRLADQLATALHREELGWSVTSDGEIYLTTVSAGAELVMGEGAESLHDPLPSMMSGSPDEVGADEVSEPVA